MARGIGGALEASHMAEPKGRKAKDPKDGKSPKCNGEDKLNTAKPTRIIHGS